ncbi:rod shape-determining protein MreC [Candidatus Fermentibacteria bacterium]|nr:rod shape-determining protein MreC [Candidatus Fermentibacteria bacterium]
MARDSAPAPAVAALAMAVSIALLLLPLPAKQAVASIIGPVLFFPAARATAFIESILTLRAENRALRFGLTQCVLDDAKVFALAEQNQRLHSMIGMRASLPYWLIPGMVLSRPGRFAGEYLAVDTGAADGVQAGFGVVSIGGLVGRVVEVRPHHSLVRTLLSPESRVSVVAKRSGAGGILRAERTVGFTVPDIPMTEDVAPGDTLVTSGLGGVFPPGLRVGVVSAVSDDHRLQLHRAAVTSLVRFHAIREVFILGSAPSDTSWSLDADHLR